MTPTSTHAGDADGVSTYPIVVCDAWGIEHAGVIARIDRFEGDVRRSLTKAGHDFLIILPSEPADSPPSEATAAVICSPAAALPPVIRETSPAYRAGPSDASVPLTERDLHFYRDGRFVSTIELGISPADVFDSTADVEMLAAELVRRRDENQLLEQVSKALSAPEPPSHHKPGTILTALRRLLRDAKKCLVSLPDDIHGPMLPRLHNLGKVASARKPATAIAAATSHYENHLGVVEDVFLSRALTERPDDAVSLLRMQAFVTVAFIPKGTDRELFLDRESLAQLLKFATLVSDPERLPGMTVSFGVFKRRYVELYAAHHRKFWNETATLNRALDDARSSAEALHRLNTISELGPALEMDALVEYGALIDNLSTCEADDLAEAPACSGCRITLSDSPNERAKHVVERIEKGIDGQMRRLASRAVSHVLRNSNDPRIERFLKVAQASEIASLSDILDDELAGYLRRFLVEARVGAILEPLLTRVAQGTPPDADDARARLRDLAAVIEDAFGGTYLALDQPPPTD